MQFGRFDSRTWEADRMGVTAGDQAFAGAILRGILAGARLVRPVRRQHEADKGASNMRKELRRSLCAAAFGAALVGCGGSYNAPPGSATPPPPPPPPPPPAAPGTYFVAGRAGFTNMQSTIPFFDNPGVPASAFGLIYADPASLPLPFAVTNTMANQLEAGGTGLDVASVSEYFTT